MRNHLFRLHFVEYFIAIMIYSILEKKLDDIYTPVKR